MIYIIRGKLHLCKAFNKNLRINIIPGLTRKNSIQLMSYKDSLVVYIQVSLNNYVLNA